MRHMPILLPILFVLCLSSCSRQPWDENTKPVRLEMRLVVDASDEDHLGLGTNVLINNSDILKASVSLDGSDDPSIQLQMTTEGTRVFVTVTEKHINQRIAVLLDGQVFAAPMVREPVHVGRVHVSLPKTTTPKETYAIAAGILKYNSLSNKGIPADN